MSDWTVRVEGVWRKFGTSARGALKYGMIDSARRLVGLSKDSEHLRTEEFWALQDVSFELGRGEALGIMGVNGSGKTTMLRILNGAYSPDRGKVTLRGRVGSLIAAGAGFSPMLSGRENVHINGLLLGLTPAEVRRDFDEIVSFAGLEEFIDMPVRNYSSGMAVRLGFSIAIMGRPDILLIDEVLAVGDIAFQKRCLDRIADIRKNGTTVIFVSHSVSSVWAVCDSGLFLNRGISSGKMGVEDVGRAYDLQNFRNAAAQDVKFAATAAKVEASEAKVSVTSEDALRALSREYGGVEGGSGDAIVENFQLCDAVTGEPKTEFAFGQEIGLRMSVYIARKIRQAIFRYSFDAVHYKFICNADSSYGSGIGMQDLEPGRVSIRTTIKNPRFRPGAYAVNVAVCQKDVTVHLFFKAHVGGFVVTPPVDRFLHDSDTPAVVDFDADFQFEKAETDMPTGRVADVVS